MFAVTAMIPEGKKWTRIGSLAGIGRGCIFTLL